MFLKLKKWWNGDNRDALPLRVPRGTRVMPDGAGPVILTPTRFASSAARERFCADAVQAEKTNSET